MKFQNVYCSQCGQGFGPGDSGFSHCQDHSASAWLTQTLPPPFDFVFEWEVFMPIGGGLCQNLKTGETLRLHHSVLVEPDNIQESSK